MKNRTALNCNVRMTYFTWGFLGVYSYGMLYSSCEERLRDLNKVSCLNEIASLLGEDLICARSFFLGITTYL